MNPTIADRLTIDEARELAGLLIAAAKILPRQGDL
jgi:hypothetical protein